MTNDWITEKGWVSAVMNGAEDHHPIVREVCANAFKSFILALDAPDNQNCTIALTELWRKVQSDPPVLVTIMQLLCDLACSFESDEDPLVYYCVASLIRCLGPTSPHWIQTAAWTLLRRVCERRQSMIVQLLAVFPADAAELLAGLCIDVKLATSNDISITLAQLAALDGVHVDVWLQHSMRILVPYLIAQRNEPALQWLSKYLG